MSGMEIQKANMTARPHWTEEDKALIKEKCAKDATETEFKLLLNLAAKYELDPLVGHIWCQKYKKRDGGHYPAQIFVGLHGFLEIANRGDRLDGLVDECIYDSKGKLIGARATVWKKGASHPFVAEVDLEEYKNDNNQLWASKPKTMIKKVAKAHALRTAFNLSGLYLQEEFNPGQVDVIDGRTGEIITTSNRVINAASKFDAKVVDAAPAVAAMGVNQFVDWVTTRLKLGSDGKEAGANICKALGWTNLNDRKKHLFESGVKDPYRAMLEEIVTRLDDGEFNWRWDSAKGEPVELEDIPFDQGEATAQEAEVVPF